MRSLLIILFTAFFIGINAQTYSISPAKTVTFTAALNNLTIHDIYQTNTGSSPILLKWELGSINLPPQWQYSMCDYQTCYSGIPAGPNAMSMVALGAQGFLGLNIDPGNTPGSGVVKIFVYQDGFKANGDTLTWYVNAGTVGVEEISFDSPVKAYPNPVKNKLNISLSYFGEASLSITDVRGRLIHEISHASQLNSIDVSGFEKGCYILNVVTADKRYYKKIIIQ